MLEEAVALFKAEADERSVVSALRFLGMIVSRRGDYDRAREHWGLGLEMAERLGDPAVLATSSNTMGILSALLGDYGAALDNYDRSVEMFRQVGDDWRIGEAEASRLLAEGADADLESLLDRVPQTR